MGPLGWFSLKSGRPGIGQTVHGRGDRRGKRRDHRLFYRVLANLDYTEFNTEAYDRVIDNPFRLVTQAPLSTFSIDVDTASYANIRRFLNASRLPPPDAVRIEEMVNYFSYDYPQPEGDEPFSVNFELAGCPWNRDHELLRIGLAGRQIDRDKRGPSNLVFLLDVSGSMLSDDKLPLVKRAMRLLVEQLTEDDYVAVVTYASGTAVRLPATNGTQKRTILRAIDSLEAGGSTFGSGGIQLAYQQAVKNFLPEGNNRVILATDGDLHTHLGTHGRASATRPTHDRASA